MAARSIAIQRILLAASNPQRSPFLRPFEARKVRALRISSRSSDPVTPVTFPSRISCRTTVFEAALSCAKMSPTKGMGIWLELDRLTVSGDQLPQRRIHRREIVFPTPFAGARWKLGIATLDFLLEENSHPRHDFQIFDDCAGDSVGYSLTIRCQSLEGLQEFRLQIGIVDRHEQFLMSALAHEIANAFVHRDAGRRHQRRH